jgi:hypothetical protein
MSPPCAADVTDVAAGATMLPPALPTLPPVPPLALHERRRSASSGLCSSDLSGLASHLTDVTAPGWCGNRAASAPAAPGCCRAGRARSVDRYGPGKRAFAHDGSKRID